jgi:hypothetical protein
MKKTRYTLELEEARKEWHAELWVNFKATLDPETLDELGISEDRDMSLNITRLCSAYIDTKENLFDLTHEHFGY